jgi:hypothetical protein
MTRGFFCRICSSTIGPFVAPTFIMRRVSQNVSIASMTDCGLPASACSFTYARHSGGLDRGRHGEDQHRVESG